MTIPGIPYIEQWFGLWAMREESFLSLVDVCRKMDVAAHLAGPGPQSARMAVEDIVQRDGNVAIINLRGRMQKQASSLGSAASTVEVRRAIRQAASDASVSSILLAVDSPGGTVAGTQDLAADIAAAARAKPVIAYIEDVGASAAYWAASQATAIYAGPTAAVGSIGTYGVVVDSSRAAENEGYKVHVVRAGNSKGAGTPGTPVTPEQLAEFQDEVNTLNEFFLAGVSSGRRMPMDQVRTLATGRVWIGQQAADAGLIDGVMSFDAALAKAKAVNPSSVSKGGRPMAAATYAEIVAACPGATPDFICDQLKAGADVATATKDFMAWQGLQIEQARKEAAAQVAAAKAEADAARLAAQASKKAPGVDPLPEHAARGSGVADARAEWDAAIAAKMATGMTRQRAVAAVAAEQPRLREEFVAAANAHRQRR